MYFTKMDLKNAYYAIPILEEHKKRLKLADKDRLYKFTYLPNAEVDLGLLQHPRWSAL